MDAGTYYIGVYQATSGNPLMTGFTREPFRITRRTLYASAAGSYGDAKVPVFSRAGDIVYRSGDTCFMKKYDGDAFAAFCKNSKGVVVPVLVSRDRKATAMILFTEDKVTELTDVKKGEYGEEQYYCTNVNRVEKLQTSGEKRPYSKVPGSKVDEKTITRILNKANGRSAIDLFWVWPAIGMTIGVAVLVQFYILIRGASSDDDDSYSGSYSGGSSYSPTSYPTYTPDPPRDYDTDDMVLNHMHNAFQYQYPGREYDPEASISDEAYAKTGYESSIDYSDV